MYTKYKELQDCLEILKKQKLLHIDMIELINRGQARLVYAKGANIVLYDKVSRIYFHTAENIEEGKRALLAVKADAKHIEDIDLVVLHQEFMQKPVGEMFALKTFLTCYQAVYTRKEKLPITGLYRMDGKPQEGMAEIRPLTLEHLDVVVKNYKTMDDPDYLKGRIERGWMYGAFVGGGLAGFAGMHGEGSLGMLEVLPEYRGRHIGKALETYMINLSLERSMTPFGQVAVENEVSKNLQKSLGLCFSKQPVYWMG